MHPDREVTAILKKNMPIYIVYYLYFIIFSIIDKGFEHTYSLGIICLTPFMEYVMLVNSKKDAPQQYERLKHRYASYGKYPKLTKLFNISCLFLMGLLYYHSIINSKTVTLIIAVLLLLLCMTYYLIVKNSPA